MQLCCFRTFFMYNLFWWWPREEPLGLRIIERKTVTYLFPKDIFTRFPLCILSWMEGLSRRRVRNRGRSVITTEFTDATKF